MDGKTLHKELVEKLPNLRKMLADKFKTLNYKKRHDVYSMAETCLEVIKRELEKDN